MAAPGPPLAPQRPPAPRAARAAILSAEAAAARGALGTRVRRPAAGSAVPSVHRAGGGAAGDVIPRLGDVRAPACVPYEKQKFLLKKTYKKEFLSKFFLYSCFLSWKVTKGNRQEGLSWFC